MNDNGEGVPTASSPQPDPQWIAIMQGMGRTEGKIDQVLAALAVQKETTDDHENRIRYLEKSKFRTLGATGVIGAVGGMLASWVAKTGNLP